MTLQEQFEQAPEVYNVNFEVVKGYEKIADEFAIGFADWFFEHCHEDQVGYYKAADLLEKYKKEKGL